MSDKVPDGTNLIGPGCHEILPSAEERAQGLLEQMLDQALEIERLEAELEEANKRLDAVWNACKEHDEVGQIKTAVMNIARYGRV